MHTETPIQTREAKRQRKPRSAESRERNSQAMREYWARRKAPQTQPTADIASNVPSGNSKSSAKPAEQASEHHAITQVAALNFIRSLDDSELADFMSEFRSSSRTIEQITNQWLSDKLRRLKTLTEKRENLKQLFENLELESLELEDQISRAYRR